MQEPEPPADELLGQVWYTSAQNRGGIWAITHENHYASFNLVTPQPLTVQQQEGIHTRFATRLQQGGWEPAELIRLARLGGGESERIVWFGYTHIIAVLSLGLVFVASLRWVPLWLRDRRHTALIASRRCPICRYDMRTTFESGCPECGWQREDED